MSTRNQTMTAKESNMTADQYSDDTMRQIAEHLCAAAHLDPDDPTIGRFLCNALCASNVDATGHWLNGYLSEAEVVAKEIGLDQYESEFRTALSKTVPSHIWRDSE